MVHNFLISRLSASLPYPKGAQFHLGSLRPHHAFLFFISYSFVSESIPTRNHPKDDVFTVSYLVNSCGLSSELAKKLSKKVQLKNPHGPNAVLGVLKKYGFSQTHIAKLVERKPLVLFANAEKTLLPKLKFFHSIGVSSTDLPNILIDNHSLLWRSLENCLIPRFEILRAVVRDDQEAVRALKRAPRSFTYGDIMNDLVPNIKLLRQYGVPQASISLLVMHHPGVASMKHSKFVEAVETAKEIGLDPLRTNFVMAVPVLAILNKAMWESRFEVYKRWGWYRETALQAFKKFPTFLMLGEERVTKSMSFLVRDMGWSAEDIAGFPVVLAYSLEKRIIPRCSVIKILKSKGLVKNHLHLGSFMCISEDMFLNKFVSKFQKDVPLLLDVYKGLIDYLNVT